MVFIIHRGFNSMLKVILS